VAVLHIDEQALWCGLSVEQGAATTDKGASTEDSEESEESVAQARAERLAWLETALAGAGWTAAGGTQCFVVGLEDIFGLASGDVCLSRVFPGQQQNGGDSESGGSTGSEPAETRLAWRRQLREVLFDVALTNTAREDLLASFRHTLIVAAAARVGADAVLLGSSATRSGAEIVANVCKGRGFSVSHDVAAAASVPTFAAPRAQEGDRAIDPDNGKILLLRPLAEILATELAVYHRWARLQSLSPVEFRTLGLATSTTGGRVHPRVARLGRISNGTESRQFSINSCAEALVQRLQRQQYQTVHTLTGSSSKLLRPENAGNALLSCVLCAAPLDPQTDMLRPTCFSCARTLSDCAPDDDTPAALESAAAGDIASRAGRFPGAFPAVFAERARRKGGAPPGLIAEFLLESGSESETETETESEAEKDDGDDNSAMAAAPQEPRGRVSW
jgi:hypothetical protein